tara:strand:+ start:1639 stop:1797 length:159 start_codon:yes stop_codon:yes gene_type:complete
MKNIKPKINKFIKTKCGIDKYYLLSKKRGFWNKLRLYWFVAIGTVRDLFINK